MLVFRKILRTHLMDGSLVRRQNFQKTNNSYPLPKCAEGKGMVDFRKVFKSK